MMEGYFILIFLVSYVLGSIPSGYLITKAVKKIDIRTLGSGNTGTTNAFRTSGKWVGSFTLLADVFKGYLSCWLAKRYLPDAPLAIAVAGFSAVLGHCYSIFLKFKAGKGVATSVGVLLFLDVRIALILAVVFFAVFFKTRIVSLSSILASLAAPFVTALWRPAAIYIVLVIALSVLVVFRHKENIKRLRNGTEYRFDKR